MILGLYGDSRSGKDTVAGILVEEFGFTQRNMADNIRKMLLKMNPYVQTEYAGYIPLREIHESCNGDWDRIKAVCYDSTEYMIGLGQAARDVIGDRVWLDACLRNAPELLVIADVRQPNEYEEITDRGGAVWNIIREGTVRRGMDGLLDGYEFEQVIYNNSTLSDLRTGVIGAMSDRIKRNKVVDFPGAWTL